MNKRGKLVDGIDKLNQAIDYIEQHLNEDIDYQVLADIAGCSSYYFQKLFLYMAQLTLSEYIRFRRLSMAAVDLQKTKCKVIDAALTYGYDSPTAFNRAFKRFHGAAPSLVKQGKASFAAYPPIRFSVLKQGGDELSVRIEKKPAIRILGIACPLAKNLEQNFKAVPDQWQAAVANGKLIELVLMNNAYPNALLGVSIHHGEQWKYMIASASTINNHDYEEYLIQASSWAVFSGQGDNHSLQALQRRVLLEWLPTSGYECDDAADVEVYFKADPHSAIYEYWLPIK